MVHTLCHCPQKVQGAAPRQCRDLCHTVLLPPERPPCAARNYCSGKFRSAAIRAQRSLSVAHCTTIRAQETT
eukprot:1158921-Pelagomonas_calceolata.AAC.6